MDEHDWPEQIADRLSVFGSPTWTSTERKDRRVNARRIHAYVQQFPPTLRNEMWWCLEQFQMLDMSTLSRGIVGRAAKSRRTLIPLTMTPGESAAVVAFLVSKQKVEPVTLASAARAGAARVCFFDDFLMSGTQAACTIRQMMGTPEVHDDVLAAELTGPQLDWLRSTTLEFCFACGIKRGAERLRDDLKDLGLKAGIVTLERPPCLEDVMTSGNFSRDCKHELRGFLEEVGISLNRTNKSAAYHPKKWTKSVCASHALGYGNTGALVATFIGVPTATVTAIWKSGTFGKKDWLPLLPRTG